MKNISKILLSAALVSAFGWQLSTAKAQDAEYKLIRHTYTANNDGTFDINIRKELKLLRNRAITAYADKGETFILYNPDIDQLTINESYTIRKDGTQVQTPQNAFIDQLPSQCTNCGRYNGIRERVVVHTALEYDCIIVLDYTIHRKSPFFEETIIFAQDCPVEKMEVIVDNKGNQSQRFTSNNWNDDIRLVQGRHAYHVVASNLPQTLVDSYLPSPMELYPSLKIVLGERPAVVDNNDSIPEANNLLMELYSDNPMDYVVAIRNYVADYIRTTDFPLALVGYKTVDPHQTFLSACGTPSDKNMLLAALLRQAGFNASYDGRFVKTRIAENNITLNYILSASNKLNPVPEGIAIDELRRISEEQMIMAQGTIAGSYMFIELPTHDGSIKINPAKLTSVRKAPLKVRNCDESYHYIIVPQANQKFTLDKPVKINYSKKGVGSIKIIVSKNKNGTIDVKRNIKIDVEDGIVTPENYKAFRQMMQEWDKYKTITVKIAK